MIEVDFSAATLTWQNAWLWLLAALMCWFVARRVFVVLLTAKGYAPTPVASRLLSHLVRSRNLSEDQFLRADGAEEQFVGARRNALGRLAASLNGKSPASSAWADGVRESLSDLRFADANRVPFPFAKVMRERFNAASVAQATEGPYLRDLDGNRSLDVSGSYGVNVTGYDSYKGFIERGWQKVKDLGIVLGPLHPLVADNMERLKRISGQEEVSFHVSGTEAVMAAVRLARFNTRRKKIVCFSGAYHGWWDGVQPGIGSERRIDDVLALKEMNPGSLDVIRLRAKEIAGVLVNPVQSFHPNSPPPNDAVLLSSDVRKTETQSASYGEWLRKLKAVCDECNVPLMFDEVYSGFRLAPGGAQQYFGVKADMVVYGKTLAGGLPIGVVCGPKSLMRRFDPDRPMRIAYVVGTFSAYPLAVGAMNEFLTWLESPEAAPAYAAVEARAAGWVARANAELEQSGLPVRVVNLGTIWTLEFTEPSRFNWLLQYYLRDAGINFSWVGTGRCLISMDYTEVELDRLREEIVAAAKCMQDDKWWLTEEEQPNRNKLIRTQLTKDMVASVIRLPKPLQAFYSEVMRRKHDDHEASHSHPTNQFLHLISSSVFIVCYFLLFTNLSLAVWMGVISLFLRQAGHALIEPPCHDAEQLLLGFDTRSKTWIVAGFCLIPLIAWLTAGATTTSGALLTQIGETWFAYTALVIFGRVIVLIRKFGVKLSMIWFVKLITDPITDIKAYYASVVDPLARAKS